MPSGPSPNVARAAESPLAEAEPRAPFDAGAEAREAAALVDETLALALHQPGARAQHRRDLARVLALTSTLLDAARDGESQVLRSAKATRVLALSAQARDARHGAGQLAQGSQRAPTQEDCEDGWGRVASIVGVCRESAQEACRIAQEIQLPRAQKAARNAEVAAKEAQKLLDERNHAYTFHADPGFSFGEGWYLAAAALLARVSIQVEPDMPQTQQALNFLTQAGLSKQVVPYRSRPRANKALPDLVARAFRADPWGAQAALRASFLGTEPLRQEIREWVAERLARARSEKKVLLWVRYGAHHPDRNTDHDELCELCVRAREQGLTPVLIGDALREDGVPVGALDMTLFWKLPLFQGADMRRAQLQLFEYMRQDHGLVGQLGVTTAGMDGPALMGVRTMYLTQAPNVRLGRWVGAVPHYEEVVREGEYLARISQRLSEWAAASNGGGDPAP